MAITLMLTPTVAFAATTIDSGECGANGDNVIWTLDSDGLLTISGDGAMEDYPNAGSAPWYSYVTSHDAPKQVVIEDGVTHIGNWTFNNNQNLKSVTIADTVESIGNTSFYNTGLTSVEIPLGVTTIGADAFGSCVSMKAVELPDSVITIGSGAFASCSQLDGVMIPNSVTDIGDSVFYRCSALSSIIIPDCIGTIPKEAFYYCTALKNVTIGAGVKLIDETAFQSCSALESITIPANVTKIYPYAFRGCQNLSSVTFEGTNPPALVSSTQFEGIASSGEVFYPDGEGAAYSGILAAMGVSSSGWASEPYDATPPTLTAGAANRTSDTAATVNFTSDEAGEYYYTVVENGTGKPAIDTSGTGENCGTTETTITLSSPPLTAGAKDIYIVVKDAAGNVSDSTFHITIPAYTPPSPTTYALTITAGTGGTVTDASGDYEQGGKINIAASPNANYTFSHWTTSSSGTFDNANSASTTFTMPAGATTITANFTYTGGGTTSYSINYDANGGTGAMTADTVTEGGSYAIKVNAFSRTDYTFNGWNTTANASGTAYAAGATIPNVQGNITLYAQWKANDTGGGSDPTPTDPTPTNPSGSFSGGSSYTHGSATGLVFIVQKAFSQFANVKVDNVTLTRNTDYTAEESSTKITLFPAYLDTLTAGTHTLTVNFTDGTYATASFTIAARATTPPSNTHDNPNTGREDLPAVPQTGDNSNTGLWIIMLSFSVLALCALIFLYRRRQKTDA